jgi:hypothetical protein
MTLIMYTVYDHPSDFPDYFVVRRFFITGETPYPEPDPFPYVIGTSLEDVRSWLPPGLDRCARSAEDEPQIVETWV